VVAQSGVVVERPITLGVDDGERIEVLFGLNEGDQVIVGNLNGVQPGQRVRPKLVAEHPATEGQS